MTLIIKELKIEVIIGILDFERVNKQQIIINSEIEYEYKNRYLDYAKIVEIIKNIMINKKFELIEEALEYIPSYLKNEFTEIKSINLEILKPTILKDCIVGVKVEKNY